MAFQAVYCFVGIVFLMSRRVLYIKETKKLDLVVVFTELQRLVQLLFQSKKTFKVGQSVIRMQIKLLFEWLANLTMQSIDLASILSWDSRLCGEQASVCKFWVCMFIKYIYVFYRVYVCIDILFIDIVEINLS